MIDDPFLFWWPVDQEGYKIERKPRLRGLLAIVGDEPAEEDSWIRAVGGPPRYYRPLDEDGLWLKFGKTCTTIDGVLQFANQYGLLGFSGFARPGEFSMFGLFGEETASDFATPRTALEVGTGFVQSGAIIVDEFFRTAALLEQVAARLGNRDREGAASLFRWRAPKMSVVVVPAAKGRAAFAWKFVPNSLGDALLYQAAEAVVADRKYRRCRNEECTNWFRLGPHNSKHGPMTITERREFCSDRCRVAYARRQKKEATVDA